MTVPMPEQLVSSGGPAAAASGHDGASDEGSAVVEFLGVSLLLLVPVVYLVLVLAQLQAAAFAVDGAAREAVRAVLGADGERDAAERAVVAVAIALDDQGLDPDQADEALALTCPDRSCAVPGATVTARVAVEVALPGVPGWLQDVVPLTVPVRAEATGQVDTFIGAP